MVEVGYCNDWKWAQKMAEKAGEYVELAAWMNARGWPTEFKQVALGVRGCVYAHLGDVLKWLGMSDWEARKRLVRDIAIHGARRAASIMATYERLMWERSARTDGGARG